MSFWGRSEEISLISRLLDKKTSSLVVLRGRRRIGKSRLAFEFSKGMKCLSFSGLPPGEGITAKLQREDFAQQLQRQLQIPLPRADDWGEMFYHLAEKSKQGRVIIIIDEITWLGGKDPTFLGKLKIAWDLYFSKNSKLIMILSGSISSWIEKNILSSTGFLGRVSLDLILEELSLHECVKFWGNHLKYTSAYEIFKILSVTGGVPKYLEEINPKISAEENIKNLCFSKHGFLYNEFEHIFADLFDKRAPIYKKIVERLSRGSACLEEIYEEMKSEKSGVIGNYVQDLVSAGFVSRDYTWHIKNGKESKLSFIRLRDNYLRFYLKYIMPNYGRVMRGTIGVPKGISSILGLQFENLVLANRKLIWKKIGIDAEDIIIDNPFFQNSTQRNPGCQVDYMIQTKDNILFLCEVKFHKEKIGLDVVKEVEQKMKKLVTPKNFSKRAVLIHVNGVTSELEEEDFFVKTICFADFLEV